MGLRQLVGDSSVGCILIRKNKLQPAKMIHLSSGIRAAIILTSDGASLTHVQRYQHISEMT